MLLGHADHDFNLHFAPLTPSILRGRVWDVTWSVDEICSYSESEGRLSQVSRYTSAARSLSDGVPLSLCTASDFHRKVHHLLDTNFDC